MYRKHRLYRISKIVCRLIAIENMGLLQPLYTMKMLTTSNTMKQCFGEWVPVLYMYCITSTWVMQYTFYAIPPTVGDGDMPIKIAVQQQKVGHETLNLKLKNSQSYLF